MRTANEEAISSSSWRVALFKFLADGHSVRVVEELVFLCIVTDVTCWMFIFSTMVQVAKGVILARGGWRFWFCVSGKTLLDLSD